MSSEVPADPPEGDSGPSFADRLRRFLATYTLHLEAGLATLTLAASVVTGLLLFFGALAALPTGGPPPDPASDPAPTNDILAFANNVVKLTVGIAAALAVSLVAHAVFMLRSAGADTGKDRPTRGGLLRYASVGTRVVETVLAGAYLAGLGVWAVLFVTRIVETPPGWLLWTIVLTGLSMPLSVLTHAVAAFFGYIFDVGNDEGTILTGS